MAFTDDIVSSSFVGSISISYDTFEVITVVKVFTASFSLSARFQSLSRSFICTLASGIKSNLESWTTNSHFDNSVASREIIGLVVVILTYPPCLLKIIPFV